MEETVTLQETTTPEDATRQETPTPTAQQEIESLEQEMGKIQKRLRELKKSSPEPVRDYELKGPDGLLRLSELFGDREDLIVIHNMGRSCAYCTLWADGFNGMVPHFESRAAFVVVSPDAPEVQREFAAERGWRFRMASAEGSTFVDDLGFAVRQEGQRYVLPGYSTFRKQADGSIVRVAKDFFGPGDIYCSIWHMFDLLEDGSKGWHPRFRYEG